MEAEGLGWSGINDFPNIQPHAEQRSFNSSIRAPQIGLLSECTRPHAYLALKPQQFGGTYRSREPAYPHHLTTAVRFVGGEGLLPDMVCSISIFVDVSV